MNAAFARGFKHFNLDYLPHFLCEISRDAMLAMQVCALSSFADQYAYTCVNIVIGFYRIALPPLRA
jgi:hypothetical protein